MHLSAPDTANGNAVLGPPTTRNAGGTLAAGDKASVFLALLDRADDARSVALKVAVDGINLADGDAH